MTVLQLFGRKKCRESQKAQRWLKERGHQFHWIDLDEKALSPREFDSIATAIGRLDDLLDEKGHYYQSQGYAYRQFDLRSELLEHGQLIKTPILRQGSKAIVGFVPERWQGMLTQA